MQRGRGGGAKETLARKPHDTAERHERRALIGALSLCGGNKFHMATTTLITQKTFCDPDVFIFVFMYGERRGKK